MTRRSSPKAPTPGSACAPISAHAAREALQPLEQIELLAPRDAGCAPDRDRCGRRRTPARARPGRRPWRGELDPDLGGDDRAIAPAAERERPGRARLRRTSATSRRSAAPDASAASTIGARVPPGRRRRGRRRCAMCRGRRRARRVRSLRALAVPSVEDGPRGPSSQATCAVAAAQARPQRLPVSTGRSVRADHS